MELWQSFGYFLAGIFRRFYFWLPSILLDPFDYFNKYIRFWIPFRREPLGEMNIPSEWFPYVLGVTLLWTAGWTYHELRKEKIALERPDDIQESVSALKDIAAAGISLDSLVLEVGLDLANGMNLWVLTREFQKKVGDEAARMVGELRLLNIIRQERQQDSDSFATGRVNFRDVVYLTEFGAQVVRRLRRTNPPASQSAPGSNAP